MEKTTHLNPILDAVQAYQALLEAKEELAAAMENNTARLTAARDLLAALMTDAEVSKIAMGDYSYSLSPKDKYSKRAGMDEKLFEQLRADGLGDIIREAVQPQTLQATMSALAADNDGELPSEYDTLINRFSYTDISRRKTARKERK